MADSITGGLPASIAAQFEKDYQAAKQAPDWRPKMSKSDAYFGYGLALRRMWLNGRTRKPPKEPTTETPDT